MKELILIRKELHKIAELSENEKNTSQFIINQLNQLNPDEMITNIGGYGIACIFKSKEKGKNIALRAELDALPISEINDFEYKSLNDSVSHKCGHDGHMTILLGIARRFSKIKDQYNGNLILLFQPAEENAQGAKKMVHDEKFLKLKIDYLFALHNLPGYPLGQIIMRNNVFASSSVGVKIQLEGKTSHAAHPEDGKNPVLLMTNLINSILAIPQLHISLHNSAMITIIHARLGEIAFGTSPGYAELMATLRAYKDNDIKIMQDRIKDMLTYMSKAYDIKSEIDFLEYFPATINDEECVNIIEKSTIQKDYSILFKENPFPWSEDFAYFTQKYKSAIFGLGSGLECPQLHNPDYDFPDELIEKGIGIFEKIIFEVLND